MFKENLVQAFNDQLQREIYSANLYLAAAGYCRSINYEGFANFFRVQAEEELFHAMKFFDYIGDRGGRIYIGSIAEPKNDFESLVDLFNYTLKHEMTVTQYINSLMQLAVDEGDFASQSFLKWFIDEQVEEEATFEQILHELKLVKDDSRGLLMLDRELAQRTFTPPVNQ